MTSVTLPVEIPAPERFLPLLSERDRDVKAVDGKAAPGPC